MICHDCKSNTALIYAGGLVRVCYECAKERQRKTAIRQYDKSPEAAVRGRVVESDPHQ